jgi:hypothetical protein
LVIDPVTARPAQSPRLQLFATLRWRESRPRLQPELTDYPLFGEMAPEQMRRVRQSPRMHIDPEGRLHILGSGRPTVLHHLDELGAFQGFTELPDAGESQITDFTVDSTQACYVLERIDNREGRKQLRKISQDGTQLWSRTLPGSSSTVDPKVLQGVFTRLLQGSQGRLFLAGPASPGELVELSSDTGEVIGAHKLDGLSEHVFAGGLARIVYVVYLAQQNRRGVSVFDLSTGQLETRVGDVRAYGWLGYPLGADAATNVYVWRDSVVAKVSPAMTIQVLAALDNVVVRGADMTVFASSYNPNTGTVNTAWDSPDAGAGTVDFHVPDDLRSVSFGAWRLVHVDAAGNYLVFGGEQPGSPGTLLKYDQGGGLTERVAAMGLDLLALEARLGPYWTWQVDNEGRMFVPITDSEGLRIIRVTAASTSV